jgi:WD40 repeat protein
LRVISLLFFCFLALSSAELKPTVSVKLSSPAIDMVCRGGKLYASCANGEVLVIERTGKISEKYRLPTQAGKAMSVDSDSGLIAIGAEDGYIYTIQNTKIQKSTIKSNSVIKKILFAGGGRLLVGTIGAEVSSYEFPSQKKIYSIQVDTSTFSDMALSPDRKNVCTVGEAGVVHVLDASTGKKKALLKGGNVDNIYKVEWQGDRIVTAGQDRRVMVYGTNGAILARFDASFLVYSAALSPSAKICAAAVDEQNGITLYDVASQSKIHSAKGHTATLSRIVFMDENSFASAADENKILIWRIK